MENSHSPSPLDCSLYLEPVDRLLARRPPRLCLYAVLICLFTGCQQEVARWDFVKAEKMLAQGDANEGLEQMRQAFEKSGEAWDLGLIYALELAKRQRRESLEICDRIRNQPEVQQNEELLNQVIQTKVECQSWLGDFSDALDTLKQLFRQRVDRTTDEFNQLAYQRSLADRELNLAMDNITTAINGVPSDWSCGERLDFRTRSIVAAALLARYFFYESARDESLEPIATAKERLQTTHDFLDLAIDQIEQKHGAYIECQSDDPSAVNLELCTARSNLVVLLVVRALVRQDLGMLESSNSDRSRANKMSKHLAKVIQNLPDENACFRLLAIATAYLDTRGFIRSKLSWPDDRLPGMQETTYQEAIQDLDVAIFACNLTRRAFKGSLRNSLYIPVEVATQQIQQVERTEATLRYHRLTTHLRAKQFAAAEADRVAIEKLGFSANRELF